MPSWSIGRTVQMYAKVEATYATAPTFASTDAFRHLSGLLHFNPFSPAKSPARYTHPSMLAMRNRRQAATFDVKHEWYPSGTINTLPESDMFLANGLGGVATNITLSTTFSGSPSTTGGTIVSGTGLAIGQVVQINIAAGASAGTYIRILTAAGTTPTWTPALPAAPVAGDTLKGGITYTLATAKQKSLDIGMYPQVVVPKNLELLGCVPNKLSWMFDSNVEPMFQVSGPAQGFAGTAPNWTAQSQPGSFTTVGAESALTSGMSMTVTVAGVAYQVTKAQVDLDNGHDVQNNASGTNKPVDFYRKSKRFISGKISAMVSDDGTMYTPSLNGPGSPVTLLIQQGVATGKIWGLYFPAVVITDVPDTPDNDADRQWAFNLQMQGVAGNDDMTLGQV
jgi:hypothetical protein